jgi:hypothetical protein
MVVAIVSFIRNSKLIELIEMNAKEWRMRTSPIEIQMFELYGIFRGEQDHDCDWWSVSNQLSVNRLAHLRSLWLIDGQANEIRSRMSTLEKRVRQSECRSSALQSALSSGLWHVKADLARLALEFAAFRAAKVNAAAPPRTPAKAPPTAAPAVVRPPGRVNWLIVGRFRRHFKNSAWSGRGYCGRAAAMFLALLWRPYKQTDCCNGHEREYFRGLHAGGVGVARVARKIRGRE